jgi:S1-C subfamily serine protease
MTTCAAAIPALERAPGHRTWRHAGLAAAAALCLSGFANAQVPADVPAAADRSVQLEAKILALARAKAAVVGLRTVAVEDAVSARSLGRTRQGSGVVIDEAGVLVLTIGYLVLEAEQVEIDLGGGRVYPARALAYDQASGFGLVQALTALPVPGARLGRSGEVATDEPLMIASGDGNLSLARLVSKRAFSGYWEYHLDSALFTVPPRTDHSGAALFNADGELLGIGSLVVNDVQGPGAAPMAGNMFVPIDLLEPILGELRTLGASRGSRRAWLGVSCSERNGEVRVLRVTEDGPADAAGLQPGDQILTIDGTEVKGLEAFYKRLWTDPAPNREVKLEIRRGMERQTVSVQATDRQNALRRAQGI